MLAVLSALAALTFLPADPPPADVRCLDASGDLIAASEPGDAVVVSVADGPWGRVPGLLGCPQVATAADGTAAIAARGRVAVRRPGGTFGAAVADGASTDPPALAVAPGGWTALLGQKQTGTLFRPRFALVLTTIAPDGTITRRTLDRTRWSFRDRRVAVDGNGSASAVWTRPKGWSTVMRTWPAGRSAPAQHVDIAASPSGRTLTAWADGRGIVIAADGGPPERVTTARNAGSPSVAIADDGAAVLAYAAPVWQVLVTTRAPDGIWSATRRLEGVRGWSSDDVPVERALETALTPDGHAVVTWPGRQLYAAASPGWQRTPLSAITRHAGEFALAGGRVAWIERPEYGTGPVRLRGARLAEGEPADTVAPVLTTRLPRRTPRTSTGRVTFAIPVRCSEACDARVRLIGHRGAEIVAAVRELAAGEAATLRVRTGRFGTEFVKYRSERRPLLEVVVTDRANNVARERQRVRFRVVEPPVLSYLVGPNHEFAMYSKPGNRAVARLVNDLIRAAARKEGGLRRRYREGMRAIMREHPRDDIDTAVTDEIHRALDVPLALAGYDAEAVMG